MVRNQQLCRVDREDAPDHYALHLHNELCQQMSHYIENEAEAVLLSDYGKGGITDELFPFLQKLCQQKKIPLALDPKPRRKLTFAGVDLLTPNRMEALALAGSHVTAGAPFPEEEVCQRIWEQYQPGRLAVTLGADGILLCEQGKIIGKIPTFAREVFDVSGAGDTVISALLLALLAGADFQTAGHFANLAAGIVVGRVGTTTASQDEIMEQATKHGVKTSAPKS